MLLVMACHFSQTVPETTWLGAAVGGFFYIGWVGVDVFFVLSGYLITNGLIAPSALTLGARMRRFYVRRTLRIFPLYYATLAVGSIACAFVGAPRPDLAFWLYVDNLPPFDTASRDAWTGHLWSLAVEEQFYLIWPAVMLLIPKARARVTALLILLGVVARFYVLFRSGPSFEESTGVVYHATFTHADGLLAGALVAIVESDPSSLAARVWSRVRLPGLLVVLPLFLVPRLLSNGYDNLARVAWGFQTLTLAYGFAVVVSVSVEGTTAPTLARLFSQGWLRACGRVSYGMYLFHWPLTAIVRPHLRALMGTLSPWTGTMVHLALLPVATVFVFLLAQASYRFFEAPFLSLKTRFSD